MKSNKLHRLGSILKAARKAKGLMRDHLAEAM